MDTQVELSTLQGWALYGNYIEKELVLKTLQAPLPLW